MRCLARMIRELLEGLTEDPWRQAHPFSADVQDCQATLFRADASREEMEH